MRERGGEREFTIREYIITGASCTFHGVTGSILSYGDG